MYSSNVPRIAEMPRCISEKPSWLCAVSIGYVPTAIGSPILHPLLSPTRVAGGCPSRLYDRTGQESRLSGRRVRSPPLTPKDTAVVALDRVNIELHLGEFTAIMGFSGSCSSTVGFADV